MYKILCKNIDYIFSEYTETSIIYKDATGFVKSTICIEDNDKTEIESSIRILSDKEAANAFARPFIFHLGDWWGSREDYSQVDESVETLWHSIENIYISTMRAVESNLPMYDRDTKRYIIFQSMVWFFRCKNSYPELREEEDQELWRMELVEELIRICVYEIRTVFQDNYEPENYYTDNGTVLDCMESEAKSQDDYEPENYCTDNNTILNSMESEGNYPNMDYQICETGRENEQPF